VITHLLSLVLAACLAATAATAQTAPPTRIRGTIDAVEGQTLSVTTREGPRVEVTLNDALTVTTVKNVALSDIKSNSYVGIATRTLPGGQLQAIEVLVFPEAMRGAGEGYYPWDLEQGSMMTNGTVTGTVETASGQELTLKFKDSSNKIVVPPGVPIVTFAPDERADLKPGAKVFFSATKNAEGKLAAGRITVEKDGVAPPM
jgi:Arc/MetJ family transcription regulator